MGEQRETGNSKIETSLPAREVVEILREWVELHASDRPDFAGAYTWAGITALAPDAPFALYRDVDVVIVSSTAEPTDDPTNGEELYRGLMLEIITLSLAEHSAEAILASPSRAANLATTTVLADPLSVLTPLKEQVRAAYAEPRWIRARVDAETRMVREQLDAMRAATSPTEGLDALWALMNALSGLLAVAMLRRPTTRRTMSLLGELLREQQRPDLHEAALELWGSANMSRDDTEALLARAAAAFDRAVEVYSTPITYGFMLKPHLRPYLVEASQAMIDEGQHRESVFWIMAMCSDAYRVLLNDTSGAERHMYASQLDAIHASLGYGTSEAWTQRVGDAERLSQQLIDLADRVAR